MSLAVCTQNDVINQIPSPSPNEDATCELQSGGSCGEDPMDYIVTYVTDDYCYGDGVHQMTAPSESFTYGWTSCCWVDFTADDGTSISGGDMIQIAKVNDITNTSPIFKHPPLWLIITG